MVKEVLTQPPALGRFRSATIHLIALTVQSNDVPGTEIVAVISFLRIAGSGAEISRIARRTVAVIFMIARRRPHSIFESSPCRAETLSELFVRPIGICQV